MSAYAKSILFVFLFCAFVVVVYCSFPYIEKMRISGTATTTPAAEFEAIKIDMPAPEEVVSSPVQFHGTARGTWYFEGSFPVQVLDAYGNILGTGIATANGEWMTEDFVPFSGSVGIMSPGTEDGEVVFKKDNPSGLPKNDAEVHIPVYFTAPSPSMKVLVYFGNSNYGSTENCTNVFPVVRNIPKSPEVGRRALEELLKGPTKEETSQGYFTNINEDVILQKLEIKKGIAYADFDEKLQTNVGGSCKIGGIREQITETLKQFSTISSVVISVDSFTEEILQP